ncbi:PREDICTED: uncharacterized protein LOC106337723 [Brassica oleracea var. oleracea]|uniref:uncharacterized protein LOC106337723 n=1 Tax=Brassica oleracea var. oleracea TaxID=109376 RepID=UPI0006A6D479|nr:PREDICTED: uncharacterized protein LOC106337723 [Brassica oleracea var. oleracea]
MEVNILPGAGVGHVVLLVGGGARVTIPPGNGFTIIVNPVAGGAMGAAGGAMGAAGGAMGAAVANENIAAITADIVQHSVNNTLSTTQILHMLRVDNTFEVHEDFVPEPTATGLFLYAMGISRGSDHHHYLNPPSLLHTASSVWSCSRGDEAPSQSGGSSGTCSI